MTQNPQWPAAPLIQGVARKIRESSGCNVQPIFSEYASLLTFEVSGEDLLRAIRKVAQHPRYRGNLKQNLQEYAPNFTSEDVCRLLLALARNQPKAIERVFEIFINEVAQTGSSGSTAVVQSNQSEKDKTEAVWGRLMADSRNVETVAELVKDLQNGRRAAVLKHLMAAAVVTAETGDFPPSDFQSWAKRALANSAAEA